MSNYNDPYLELWGKTQLKAADYAGAIGFSKGTLKEIIEAAKLGDTIRVQYLAQGALENINNVCIKYDLV